MKTYRVMKDFWDEEDNRNKRGANVDRDPDADLTVTLVASGSLVEVVGKSVAGALSEDGRKLVTIIDLEDGEISTPGDPDEAKRRIAFGSAVETAPEDPEAAKLWLAKLYSDVCDQMHAKGAWKPSEFLGRQMSDIEVFRDFSDWCHENGFRALPVQDVNAIVRYMLQKRRDGAMDSYVKHYANVISVFHGCTRHPILKSGRLFRGKVSKTAIDAYTRAMGFAGSRVRGAENGIYVPAGNVAAYAMRMFPDGDVPRTPDEIAA